MKNTILYIILGAILAVGLGIGIYFIVNNNISANAQTYVSVSINPAVEFTVNEDGLVISTVATDAEGDQIIQSYDFYGMPIDIACETFTQLCINAGYVVYDNDETSEDPNEVLITVISEDADIEEDIENKIRLKLNSCFQNNGVFGFVSMDILAEYIDQAIEYDISVGHIKLIMAALTYNPELDFEELVNMPINEVVKLVNASHKNMVNTTSDIRSQLKLDLDALKASEEYVDMFTALEAINQIEIDLNNDALTSEQREGLENQLADAEASFDEIYGDLFDEYKDAKAALIDQAKEDSKQALETIKSQYRARVQNHKEDADNAKNNSNNVKNRISTWQEEQENPD